jgi:hypothetical protein
LSRLYSTRNVISLFTQGDEEETLAASGTPKEITAAVTQSADEEQLELIQTAEDDNVAVTTQTTEEPNKLNNITAEEENVAVTQDKEVMSIGPSSDSITNSMRSSFYKIYSEHFESVKEGGTSVMTNASYDEKVQLLIDSEKYKGGTKPLEMQNAMSSFVLIGQVKGSQL